MIEPREITKKDIFTFELKYLSFISNNAKEFYLRFNLEEFFKCQLQSISETFKWNDKVVLEFLEDFKEVINWNDLFRNNEHGYCKQHYLALTNRFNEFFSEYIWDTISHNSNNCISHWNFMRVYKNHLNWEYISKKKCVILLLILY